VGNNHYSATNPCRRFRYDNSTGVLGSVPSGITLANTLGHVVEAETDSCASPITQSSILTDEWFSYSARGENLDLWESTSHSGGWYHAQQDYFANGVTQTLQGFKGTGTPFSDLFTYNLDGKGRPYGMVDTTLSSSIWNSTAYNVADQPTAVVPSAGGTESFAYDGNSGRMTQWSSTAASKTQTGNLTWNANGTLWQMQITDTANSANAQTCSYTYDDLARLKSAHCGTVWSQDFTYDAWGNINKSGSVNFSSQGGTGNRVPGFTYDSAGNVTNDGANTYSYNAEGSPISAAGVQMTFDALGRAVERNNGSSYTQIVYSPSGLKYAYMNGQTLNRYLAPMAGGMAAVHVHGSPDTGYFQHSDWLGSSRFASTGSGTVQYDRAYAPFGEVYAEQGGTTNRNFTGQTEDTTPGIYDFLFRQQSQSQGRWLVPDPAGLAAVDLTNPQTWNRYAYLSNNPLNAVDPLGLYLEVCPPDYYGGDCSAPPAGGGDGGIIIPCWWCDGGGGGHPRPTPPPSPPPSQPPAQQPVHFPNETLGIPNGMNVNLGGPLGAILPSAICGDMGPCNSIGAGFGPEEEVLLGGLCVAQPEFCAAILIGSYITVAYGPQIIQTVKDITNTTGSIIDCWNQYAEDLQACKDAYPPGPQRQECFQKAKAKLDYCRGNIKGPVQ
jgi:RHS repeat-associated protein